VSRSWTGWLAPWWPKRRRRVSAPAASPMTWWPRQMPRSGRPSSMMARARATGPASRAGSPGPGDRTTPATSDARTSEGEDVCGRIRTRTPRRRSELTMLALSPKSTMATRGAAGSSPSSRTSAGETWATKSWSSQRSRARAIASARTGSVIPGSVMIARWHPDDRRRRASARVSTPAIAGMRLVRRRVASWRASSRTAAVACATTRPRSHGRVDWSSATRRP